MKLTYSTTGRILGSVLAATLIVLFGGRASVAQQSDQRDYIPLATSINALMVALVDHSAHEVWAAAAAQSLTRQGWLTAEQHATQLIAASTLVSLGGTGPLDSQWVAKADWQQWSQSMADGAAAALAAVQNTDQAALNEAGQRLIVACDGCHQEFKPDIPTEGLTHIPHYSISSTGNVTLKSAVVALAAEPALRAEFEDGLVAKARALGYDAVTTYDLVPDVTDVDDADFVERLVTNDIGAVLMIRPAAVGPGSTLQSVRDSVSPSVYSNMRAFARELSPSGEDDILAVVHLAIYLVSVHGTELISSGAVWLDKPNPSREEGIERLQDLIVANVNGVRPAIREHLGLPPLQ